VHGWNATSDAPAVRLGSRASLSLLAVLKGLAAALSAGVLLMCVAYAGMSYAGYKSAPVLSGSMRNVMPVGSLVIVKPESASNVHVGDVVMFSPPGYYGHYTHRVVSIKGSSGDRVFTTKGDMNKAPDPWRLRSVNGNGRVGKFVTDIPYAGYVVEYAHDWRVRFSLLIAFCAVAATVALRRIWGRRDA
jgi:signal peptidase I